MSEEQIVKDGQKILKIIESCVTIDQLAMAEAIMDRYYSKWEGKVDTIPYRFLYKRLEAKYDVLLKIFSENDDGTEHF